jgi:hypothetical protein
MGDLPTQRKSRNHAPPAVAGQPNDCRPIVKVNTLSPTLPPSLSLSIETCKLLKISYTDIRQKEVENPKHQALNKRHRKLQIQRYSCTNPISLKKHKPMF